MKPVTKTTRLLAVTLAIGIANSACNNKNDDPGKQPNKDIVLTNQSTTPALVMKKTGFEQLEVFTLIGSDDKLAQSPNFVFGGSADGTGILKQGDGYTMLVNHEDNFSVSRISLDKTFKPVKGEYILNSNGGQWRLCSATLATPQEHGFGPLYLTCGETDEESRINAIDPSAPATSSATPRDVAGLGRWGAENAVPLPKTAYSNKTVILIGDDDSGPGGGQLAMYVSNTIGELNNGSLYMMKRKDNNQREMDMVVGTPVDVEFVKIDNQATLTGAQINALVDPLKAIKFGRVEDIDYRKGGGEMGREIYFNVTGLAKSGVNADGGRTVSGRTYRLKLDAADPLKGRLEVILDGDDKTGPAKAFQNVDNLCVTNNYVYIQEDANGYGTETHDAYLYQYNILSKELKVVLELDHHRTAADAATYNVPTTSGLGKWEYGSLVDISDVIGVENVFTLCIQPHSWTGAKYKNPDGGSKRPDEQQASQILVLKGLPR